MNPGINTDIVFLNETKFKYKIIINYILNFKINFNISERAEKNTSGIWEKLSLIYFISLVMIKNAC